MLDFVNCFIVSFHPITLLPISSFVIQLNVLEYTFNILVISYGDRTIFFHSVFFFFFLDAVCISIFLQIFNYFLLSKAKLASKVVGEVWKKISS